MRSPHMPVKPGVRHETPGHRSERSDALGVGSSPGTPVPHHTSRLHEKHGRGHRLRGHTGPSTTPRHSRACRTARMRSASSPQRDGSALPHSPCTRRSRPTPRNGHPGNPPGTRIATAHPSGGEIRPPADRRLHGCHRAQGSTPAAHRARTTGCRTRWHPARRHAPQDAPLPGRRKDSGSSGTCTTPESQEPAAAEKVECVPPTSVSSDRPATGFPRQECEPSFRCPLNPRQAMGNPSCPAMNPPFASHPSMRSHHRGKPQSVGSFTAKASQDRRLMKDSFSTPMIRNRRSVSKDDKVLPSRVNGDVLQPILVYNMKHCDFQNNTFAWPGGFA